MYFTKVWIEFIKKNIPLCAASIVMIASMPLNEVALPHVYGKFISNLEKGDKSAIRNYAVAIVCLLIILQGLSIYDDNHESKIYPKSQGFITLEMVKRIMEKTEEDYCETSNGSMIVKFAKIPELLIYWISTLKNYMLPNLFTFAFIGLYFLKVDLWIGLGFITTILYMGYNLVSGLTICKNVTEIASQKEGDFYNEVDDILNNMLSIFTNNKTQSEIDRLQTIKDEFAVAYRKAMYCGSRLKIRSFALLTLFCILFLHRCIKLVSDKSIDISVVISMFMMFTGMFTNIVWCIGTIREIAKDFTVIVETDGFIANINKMQQIRPDQPVPYTRGLGMWNVDFSYPKSEKRILDGISFHIDKGERVVITGENGMGKSTITKLIMGFYAPSGGALYVDGMWYSDCKRGELRKKIGYIPQNTILFNRSIIENILYGNENITREALIEYIDKLGVKNELGDLDRSVGKYGNNLSGGQRQLVWMIRILLKNPEYIILDEPTNSLDTTTKNLLKQLLSQLSRSQTLIAISHDPEFINFFDRKINIHGGKIIF